MSQPAHEHVAPGTTDDVQIILPTRMPGPGTAHAPDLATLAEQIRTAHAAVSTALRDGVRHALAAGQLLLQAKQAVGHGGWSTWLQRQCRFSPRTAQAYMRLARELPKLPPAKAQRAADRADRHEAHRPGSGRRGEGQVARCRMACRREPGSDGQ